VNHDVWMLEVGAPFLKCTSSSVIAEGPRDALSQLKSCQLLHNCTKNHIWLEGLPFLIWYKKYRR